MEIQYTISKGEGTYCKEWADAGSLYLAFKYWVLLQCQLFRRENKSKQSRKFIVLQSSLEVADTSCTTACQSCQ